MIRLRLHLMPCTIHCIVKPVMLEASAAGHVDFLFMSGRNCHRMP